jgi:predicted nuclease of restriction endonuclease-like (RecB) superfamily
MAKQAISKEYKIFLEEIKRKVYEAQYQAMRKVNKELISLYWYIGQSIVTRQKRFKWGKALVETLAKVLQKEFAGMDGLSSRNLRLMRQFYREYEGDEKLQPLVSEIGWSHNIIIMEKCKDKLEREFYIKMTIKYGWYEERADPSCGREKL